ncbi:MAG: HIT domain-containing protein [Rothia sp. (in: high G+C Gram-positive bacteria)]|nr:HIT domain-containing protein [Rothia sp. (in: high G+C Gram-positive bacteria)]
MAETPTYQTDDFELPAVPDAFQRLWTPHRRAYVKAGQQDYSEATCPFCSAPHREDRESLIVHRGQQAFVLLNLYPYNPGHLLICPYRHVADYDQASPAEVEEIAHLTQEAMGILRRVSKAHGFNIGINQGKIGGAGIADHLHQHLVPRWSGDTNFLPIVAGAKTVTQTLAEIQQLLAQAWKETYPH